MMQITLDDLTGAALDPEGDGKQPKDEWRAHRLPSQKAIMRRMQATSRVEDAIGQLEHGVTIHLATLGSWSTHDVLIYLLERMGPDPADVVCATWSVGELAVRMLADAKRNGSLRSLKMLLDWRVTGWNGSVIQLLRSVSDQMRVTATHAKVFTLINRDWAFVYFGSANITANPRIEVQCLVESREVAEFHRSWIQECLDRGEPFGKVADRPNIRGEVEEVERDG